MPRERGAKLRKNEVSPAAEAPGEPGGPLARTQRLETLAGLPQRGRIKHRGYVESITILPAQQAPTFAVSVVDHPAPPGGRRSAVPHLRLIFVGQRRVPGIWAGTRLSYEGMVAPIDGVATIFNPRYEILPDRGFTPVPRADTKS